MYTDRPLIKVDQSSTLVNLLRSRAIVQPNQKAYTFLVNGETEEISFTYQELDQKARAIASFLQDIKATGERALLIYPPGLEFIAAFFGCLYAGVIAVPVYPPRQNQRLTRLQAIAADADAQFILSTNYVLESIEKNFSQESKLAMLRCMATDNINVDVAEDWQEPTLATTNLAFLQYTSGSTGMPKGVMVSHGNLLHNLEMIKTGFQHTEETIFVGWLPLFHDMGLIGNVLQPLYLGIQSYLISPVDFLQRPRRWLEAISRYKATTSGGPNFGYDLCISKITPEQKQGIDLSSWQIAFNGAEPIHAETQELFASTFACCGFRPEAFYPCYGMAETTVFISGGLKTNPPVVRQVDAAALQQNQIVESSNKPPLSRKIVGCGRAWLDEKIIIVNPDSLQECLSGEVGEIWVSGAHVTQGYWNQPSETDKTFKAFLADANEVEGKSSGPFLRTGDLGFLDGEELFVTGRIKDVIIIRGRNHYPQDIELTVENSHPSLKPGCSAAITVEIKGEERLVIIQEVERTYLKKLDVNQVVGDIRQAVTTQHDLQIYALVLVKPGTIPKTSSGKIQRYACRASYLAGSLDVIEDWSENPAGTAKFLNLNAEIETLYQQIQTPQE